jgi:hypothetical protein
MNSREREQIGEDIIAQASVLNASKRGDLGLIRMIQDMCGEIGLEFFSSYVESRSRIQDKHREIYPKLFPTLMDWYNYCYDHNLDNLLIPFEIWFEVMGKSFPQGVLGLGSYLGASARQLWHTRTLPNKMTYRQLMTLFWSEPRIRRCPGNMKCFSFAVEGMGDDDPLIVDDEDQLPFLVFNRNGFDNTYTDQFERSLYD